MIIAELDKRGKGYNDEHISLKSLFFADDALMLSHSLKDAKDNLDIITQISREYGLEMNSEKSCVMICNVREQHEHLRNIKVVQIMKYIGMEINNKRNNFKTQRGKIVDNARNIANITYSVIEKRCNKLLIGKTFWKSIALPSLLYGTNIISLSDDNIKNTEN